MRRVKPISHEDRLSVIDHLDELRSRLVISLLAFGVAFGLCAWQNDLILDILNKPLPDDVPKPLTFGVTEAFMTTVTNSGYAALLLALPIVLYEFYAFVLPAFSPREKRVAVPLLLMVPFLFIAGVVFCYFIVLPPAVDFLLQFNADEFNTQVRARDYYSFATLTMLAMGLGFQVPVVILGLVRGDPAQEPPLRDPRLGGAGDAPSHGRPGVDADRDGADLPPLRAEHRAGPGVRRSRRGRRGRLR